MSCKETLFGVVPEHWNVSTIGEVAELKQGLQISKKMRSELGGNGYIPLLKITDLPTRNFSEYVKEIPEGYVADVDDIIYTRTGQVGLVYTGVYGCVHNNCFKVIPNKEILDRGYVFYYLKSDRMIRNSNNIASGSVQKDLTHKAFKTVKIGYPSIQEQKKIADILSSLDEKIELNNEMNKTLEEMAQVLFKRWFVDFEFPNEDGEPYKSSGGEMIESELGMIPKGWRILTLDDLCVKITDGSHFSPKHCETGVYPMLSVKDMRDYGFDYQSCKKINEDDYKKMVNSDCVPKINDILVAKDGSYLKHIFITNEEREEAILSSIAIFRPNTNVIYSEVLLNMLKQPLLQKKVKENYVSGSALPRIVLKDFKKLQVVVPTICVQNNIIEVFKAYRRQILINTNQNESLINLRDSLLPKLMSGEIRVEDIKANL